VVSGGRLGIRCLSVLAPQCSAQHRDQLRAALLEDASADRVPGSPDGEAQLRTSFSPPVSCISLLDGAVPAIPSGSFAVLESM
jgi:hypothetical protein